MTETRTGAGRIGSRPPEPLTAEPAALHAPGMLLVGAAGRGAGGTGFACSVVRRVASRHDVVAVEVTTAPHCRGACPLGEADRGSGAEPAAGFALVEVQGGAPGQGKGQGRLRESGAQRVFRLHARPAALLPGAQALLERIGAGTLCVCDASRLRQAIEPGLFCFLRQEGAPAGKAPAAASQADVEVLFDGGCFSPSPAELEVVDGARWAWRLPATAIVLAGGRSRRMGRDKALLPVDGRPLIERVVSQLEPYFREVLVSTAEPDRYSFLGRRLVVDRAPDQGPLRGIASALAASGHEVNLVVPCDLPDVPIRLALRLLRAARGAEGAVPVTAEGQREPLFAVYHRRTLARLEAALAAGERKITNLYELFDLRYVALPAGEQVANINTPEDYTRLQERR